MALKRKAAATGKRALRASSSVDWSSQLPSPVFAACSVAPDACHLVREALQRPLAATREDAQNGNRRATIPNWLEAVETAAPSPRCDAPVRLFHPGWSHSPARYKLYSAVPRNPSLA